MLAASAALQFLVCFNCIRKRAFREGQIRDQNSLWSPFIYRPSGASVADGKILYKESGPQNKVRGCAAKLHQAQCSNEGIEKIVKVVLFPQGRICNLTCLSELASFSNNNRKSTITSAFKHELITFFIFFPLETHLTSFCYSPSSLVPLRPGNFRSWRRNMPLRRQVLTKGNEVR